MVLDDAEPGSDSRRCTPSSAALKMASKVMEKTLIPALLELVRNLMATAQEVRVQRPQCKLLAGHLMGLTPLLVELQKVPLTGSSVPALRTLMHELIRAQKVMQKMKDLSTLKLFFKNKSLADGLSEATSRIQASLSSLPLVQVETSVRLREQVNQLKGELADLITEMSDQNSESKDQQDFKHELTGVLRAHNMANSSGGGAKVIEQLVTWLAERFDSDVDTVRDEWEAVKEETVMLREEIAFTSENKRQWEQDVLQTLVFIDSQKQQECTTCASNSFRAVTTKWEVDRSPEFTCTICLNLMTDPVIIPSGYSYCRECIMTWFQDKDTCPNTNSRVAKGVLIDNIALRNLIRRCMETNQNGSEVEGTLMRPESSRSASSNASFDQASLMEFINEESEQMEVRELPSAPPLSNGPASPPKAVVACLTILRSNRPLQIILKSLKQLISFASYSKGKLQLFEANGIPPIANLLKERDTAIAEKAAGVLEALTFEVKGGSGSTLSFEQRDRISSAVAHFALGDLIDLMQFGSNAARLKAAQTVINIIGDEEIRFEYIHKLGMVTAFCGMMAVGEEFLFPNEGRSLCVKGLKLLSGEKPSGSVDDAALTISLLRLAALEASPQVVREALVALHGLVRSGGESICILLRDNKAIPFLVRSISGRHSREEALRILSEMSLIPGMPEAIVEHELFFHLLPVLSEVSEEGDCSIEATRLFSACLSSVKGDVSRLLSSKDLKGFVGLLGLGRTSSASKVDMLSALLYLCRESSALRVTFLNSAGVGTLLLLAKSASSAEIKESISHLIKVLASFPVCSKDIRNQGGMQLIECLLVEGSLECRSQAVIAAESLITGPEGPMISLDGFPFESVVDALSNSYAFESRGAAAGLMLVFAERRSQASMDFDKNVVDLLIDMVNQVDNGALGPRKKAATALLRILNHDGSLCPHVADDDGLMFLIEFWKSFDGAESRSMIVQLVSTFCQADSNSKEAVIDVGGAEILLEALEKGRMKEEAAIALGRLLEDAPSRKAVVQAGFIQRAIKLIGYNSDSQLSVELIRGLIRIIDNQTDAAIVRESDGPQTFVCVLETRSNLAKQLASAALAKVVRLDRESAILMGKTQGIHLLCKHLNLQLLSNSTPFNEIGALEALDAIAEDQGNRLVIVQEQGIPMLISISERGFPKAQELALQILLNLSRSPLEHNISGALIDEKICTPLFQIIQAQSRASENAVFTAICIVRNISLAGDNERMVMLEEGDGVIKVLLDRIRHHNANASAEVVRGAVMALEKFMLSSRGKMVLIREGGIRVIVDILHHRTGSGQAKTFGAKVLVMLARDPQASKEVCNTIIGANIISCLKGMLELVSTSDGACRVQACTLLQLLMCLGPRSSVCKKIREEQVIPKLLELRFDAACQSQAVAALDLLKSYDKESRRIISGHSNNLTKWSSVPILSEQSS